MPYRLSDSLWLWRHLLLLPGISSLCQVDRKLASTAAIIAITAISDRPLLLFTPTRNSCCIPPEDGPTLRLSIHPLDS